MIKRRKFIRVVSYLVAVCIAFAAAGSFSARAKGAYEKTLEKVRFEALNSLCEYTHELSGGLSLLSVSQGDAVADSAGYVSSRAAGAMSCAECFDSEKTANITAFLEAVYELSQNFSGNKKSRERASELSDYAEELYYHLSDLSVAVTGGKYSLSEYGSAYSPHKKPYFEDYLEFKKKISEETETVQSFTVDYDFLLGKETVSPEFARKKASEITDVNENLWRINGESNRDGIEVYSLAHGDTTVEICRAGGAIYRIVNPVPCEKAVYSGDDAIHKARDFVKAQGYNADELLGSRINPFTADFYFAPKVNGVLLLTAHIEVSVCLSSVVTTFFDASEYIKNYREGIRISAGTPDLSALLADTLTVEKSYVCMADIDGREKLCYLAICPFDGGKVWVYTDYFSLRVVKMQKFSLLN